MRIRALTVSDVRGVPNGRYEFGDAITLVTGAGPSGKTSLLEAIIAAKEMVASYGAGMPQSHYLRRGTATAQITARWLLDERERAIADATDDPSRRPPLPAVPAEVDVAIAFGELGRNLTISDRRQRAAFSEFSVAPTAAKLEYFDAERRVRCELWHEPLVALGATVDGSERLSIRLSKYGFVRRFLGDCQGAAIDRLSAQLTSHGVITQADEVDTLGPVKQAIAALAPDLRLARVELGEPGGARVWFARRDGREVELARLSASEEQAVLFATTFARMGLGRSLVLVDLPERFIPRARQLAFFRALVALAPEGQIVAATESREILDGTPEARVIDLAS
jgi:predicted ATPase